MLLAVMMLAAMLVAPGCVKPTEAPPAPPLGGPQADNSGEVGDLKAENQKLRTQIEILESQARDAAQRNDDLAKKLNDLQFENRQQQKQIEGLAGTIKERDECRAEAVQLRKAVADLVEFIKTNCPEQAAKLPASAATATAPATKPASEP
jgi:peptidoglycan hydrolase CwlO-like protein